MKVLITGATGYIGSSLAKKLKEDGHYVRCLVRTNSNVSYLKELDLDLHKGNLLDIVTLKNLTNEVDIVYHLGGVIYARSSSRFHKCNVEGTKNLLETCKNSRIMKFIYISSAAVYKPPLGKVLLKESSLCEPITLYGRSKLEAEQLVRYYETTYKIPAIIVRAPVIYGPKEPRELTKFFLTLIKNKKAFVIGDGNNFRSLCYIDNLVNGLILIAESSSANAGKIYNISDDVAYTYNEIIKMSSEIIHDSIKICYLPNLIGNIFWTIFSIFEKVFGIYFIELYAIKSMTLNLGCDVTKIKQELGYRPTIDLRNGLSKTFTWIAGE